MIDIGAIGRTKLAMMTVMLLMLVPAFGQAVAAEASHDAVWLALIIAIPAVLTGTIAPAIMLSIKNRSDRRIKEAETEVRRRERQEDNDRADKIRDDAAASAEHIAMKVDDTARQAREAAALLKQQQDAQAAKTAEVARLLEEANERAAQSAKEIAGKVAEVKAVAVETHGLADGEFTKQKISTLNVMKAQVLLLLDNVELNKAAGRPASPERLEEIEVVRREISALEADIVERKARVAAMAAATAAAATAAAAAAATSGLTQGPKPIDVTDERTATAAEAALAVAKRQAVATEKLADTAADAAKPKGK